MKEEVGFEIEINEALEKDLLEFVEDIIRVQRTIRTPGLISKMLFVKRGKQIFEKYRQKPSK